MPSYIRSYIRQVSKLLRCKHKEKRAILVKLQYDLELFSEAHANGKAFNIICYFGTPEETAQRYMEYLAECVEFEKLYIQITSA